VIVERRHFQRRRQCGGAARDHGRAGRNLHLGGSARPGRRSTQGWIRRSRRTSRSRTSRGKSGSTRFCSMRRLPRKVTRPPTIHTHPSAKKTFDRGSTVRQY
jgi:hypothetical protein